MKATEEIRRKLKKFPESNENGSTKKDPEGFSKISDRIEVYNYT
jgi:hypothetical protein